MSIRVTSEHLRHISSEAELAYPHECCGFLIGTSSEGVNVLKEVFAAENEWQDTTSDESRAAAVSESRRNRYLITPDQYKRADARAREQGLGIIGYYHSHPDHPAEPSRFDLEHSCWPGESYVIVSVERGRAALVNSFTKPDYTRFEREEIEIDEN